MNNPHRARTARHTDAASAHQLRLESIYLPQVELAPWAELKVDAWVQLIESKP
ncbi:MULTISPECIES: hypothetical protein [Pseudomonadaceae]|uniref:hypothetical protein n=1 Tax=Pseudomonadaceae TaxID=135621 RepID=UPI001428B611|nr:MULTISPECIES: hypothetical protein [Pseudomonas]